MNASFLSKTVLVQGKLTFPTRSVGKANRSLTIDNNKNL